MAACAGWVVGAELKECRRYAQLGVGAFRQWRMFQRVLVLTVVLVFCSGFFAEDGCGACNSSTPSQPQSACGQACAAGTHCDLRTRTCVAGELILDTNLESAPAASAKLPKARFTFVTNAEAATFECQVDAGPFTACTSPFELTVAEGPHTFAVRAVKGTSVDTTPATYEWTVDATPPDTLITQLPTTTGNTWVLIPFTSTEPASQRFKCQFDTEVPYECTESASRAELAIGPHTFTVYATDLAGNVDPTPAQVTWTILTPTPDICGQPVYFSLHSSVLTPEAIVCLDQVVSALANEPMATAVVDGHRDATEAAPLSNARAQAVIDFFINQRNQEPNRFQKRNFGAACDSVADIVSLNPRVNILKLAEGEDEAKLVKSCGAP